MIQTSLWKKSYILEFYQNEVLQDAFAFSVPPQNEEINYSQRISETKTFGGVVIDDYGNDLAKISLSGTTINQELKNIYRSVLANKKLSGEDEIFYLKDLLEKYGQYKNLKNKKILLYCLDKSAKKNKYWQVVINDYRITRSKENPFAYFYSINFTQVIPTRQKENENVFRLIKKVTQRISKSLEYLQNFFSEYDSFFKTITDFIQKTKNSLLVVEEELSHFYEILDNVISPLKTTVEEVRSLGETIISSAQRFIVEKNLLLVQSVTELAVDTKGLVSSIIDICKDPESLASLVTNDYQQTIDEIADNLSSLGFEIEKDVNTIVSNTKKTPETNNVVIPGNSEENDRVYLVKSFKQRTISDNDTYDSVSKEIYGTTEFASLIANFNKKAKLEVGETLYIPILDEAEKISNEIYNNIGVYDNYGIDICSNNGIIGIEDNDFTKVDKIDNLSQAIINRLSTVINSRIRQEIYGIRSAVGSIDVAQNYILASIEETLKQEPRIKDIEQISFTTENEQIYINVIYTDVNDNKQIFWGSV